MTYISNSPRAAVDPQQVNQQNDAAPTAQTQGRPGTLGGQTVQQAAVAHAPARAGSFLNRIADFFSSIGSKLSDFFQRAPRAAANPAQGAPAAATAQAAAPTSPKSFSAADLKQYYNSMKSHADSSKSQMTTFLRLSSATTSHLKDSMKEFSQNFADDIRDSITSEIVLSNARTDDDGIDKSVGMLKHAWNSLFGNDFITSNKAASNLPDSTKSILTTGLRAIEDSSLDDLEKAQAKRIFFADVVLKSICPALSTLDCGNDSQASKSLKELSKAIQTIANGFDSETTTAQQKQPFHEGVLAEIGGDIKNMQSCMYATMELAAQKALANP